MNVSEKKLREILIINVMQTWGGGEEYLLNICRNVDGYQYLIASSRGLVAEKFRSEGLKTFEINSLVKIFRSSGRWTPKDFLKTLKNIMLAAFGLVRLIIKEKPEIILANGNFAAIYTFFICALLKKKLIIPQHLIYEKGSLELKIIRFINKFPVKFVCVSNAVKDNIQSEIGQLPPEKLAVIWNGISLPDIQQEKNRAPGDIVNIGMVGSLIGPKGIDIVLKVFNELLAYFPDIRLNIFGTGRKDDPESVKYENNLYDYIAVNNIKDKVCFYGFVESRDSIYNPMDIIVNYSLQAESFSLITLEAMAYRKIIISPDQGGPREIVQDNINGFLVEPNNPQALKDILNYCIKMIDSQEFSDIRENARKTVENNFSLRTFAANYKSLFDKYLS